MFKLTRAPRIRKRFLPRIQLRTQNATDQSLVMRGDGSPGKPEFGPTGNFLGNLWDPATKSLTNPQSPSIISKTHPAMLVDDPNLADTLLAALLLP
jgi:hypothetical protein